MGNNTGEVSNVQKIKPNSKTQVQVGRAESYALQSMLLTQLDWYQE